MYVQIGVSEVAGVKYSMCDKTGDVHNYIRTTTLPYRYNYISIIFRFIYEVYCLAKHLIHIKIRSFLSFPGFN